MVEFYVVFEQDDAAIMGDDCLDLILFWREPFTRLLKEAGFGDISDYVGFTPEMNDINNQNLPPDMHVRWSEKMYNWTEPETAMAMWAVLRHALETQPELFQEWPGMVEEVDDTLDIAERVFQRAVDRQARWFIPAPGF